MDEAIDLARQKKLPFRVNRGQEIDFSINANNTDGTPYDFTGHTAEMYVYNSFAKTDSPEFTITITLSSGTIAFSHAAITRRREDFVYQLWITDASGYRQPWINGPFLVLNREWDHEDSEDTIIISPNGDNITLTITPLSGGGGSGDVVGPASSVDSNFAAFDGTDGKTIKDSGVNAGSFQAALGFTPVPNTRAVNGHPLSADITLAQTLNDVGAICDLAVYVRESSLSITNQPTTEQDLGVNTRFRKRFDATNYSYARVCADIQSVSTSANNPRLYPSYSIDSGANWITIGTGLTNERIDLTSLTNQATAWIALPEGAKGNFMFRVSMNGGDSAGDPILGNVHLQFKT